MSKRGITLVEVVVALGLFSILSTIIVGAFITVLNMKALTSTTKETQQKLRTAIELVSRLGRQANQVEITPNPRNDKTVIFYFSPGDATNASATKFTIGSYTDPNTNITKDTLITADCVVWVDPLVKDACAITPGSWTESQDLLGGLMTLDTTQSYFSLNTQPTGIDSPPTITMDLAGRIDNIANNGYYSADFRLDNKIILESLPWSL